MVSLPVFDEAEGGNGASGSIDSEDKRCGHGLEKIYKTTAVRYG